MTRKLNFSIWFIFRSTRPDRSLFKSCFHVRNEADHWDNFFFNFGILLWKFSTSKNFQFNDTFKCEIIFATTEAKNIILKHLISQMTKLFTIQILEDLIFESAAWFFGIILKIIFKPIFESAARFFVVILKFIFRPNFEIRTSLGMGWTNFENSSKNYFTSIPSD